MRSRVVGPSMRSARAITARRLRITCAISEGVSPMYSHTTAANVVLKQRRTRLRSRVARPSMRSARAITARRLRTGRYISASVSLTHWPTTASNVVLEVVLAARRCKCALSSPAVAPLHHSLLRSRTINESGRQGAPGHGWHAAISRFARPANVHIVPGTVGDYCAG